MRRRIDPRAVTAQQLCTTNPHEPPGASPPALVERPATRGLMVSAVVAVPRWHAKGSGVQIPSAPPGTTHREDPRSGPGQAGRGGEPAPAANLGLLRTAAPDRPWRSWPRSWGQACAGRRRRRPGRRGAGSSSQLDRDRDRDCDGREPQPPVLPGLRRVAVRLPDDPTHRARDRAAASWRPQPPRPASRSAVPRWAASAVASPSWSGCPRRR